MSDSPKPALDCVIDVSHNNGAIDWTKVDPAIVLVFIKATQGSHFKDPLFARNRDGCLATGRMVVPYHFLDASDADEQIANFETCLKNGQPFALDWEGRAGHTAPPEDVEYIGQQIGDDMGWPVPVGYWGILGSTPGEPTALMGTWTRWVPRYRIAGAKSFDEIEAAGFAGLIQAPFWQYTEAGWVAGIAGNVDRSIWRGSLDELKAWYKGPASTPVA